MGFIVLSYFQKGHVDIWIDTNMVQESMERVQRLGNEIVGKCYSRRLIKASFVVIQQSERLQNNLC